MHKIQMYENLRDMLEQEVTEIERKGNLDAQSLDHLYKLMATLKNTDKCIEREEGGSSYGRSYNMRGSYMPDMMSRDNFRDSSYRGRVSYDNSYGYSRDNSRKKMVEKLTTLMDDTMSEHDRNAIMDCIDKIK